MEKLFELHRSLGIERSVIVQSARFGADNSLVELAIKSGGGRYLGVGIVDIDVSDTELGRMSLAGFRGVRFNFMRHIEQAASIEAVMELTPRLARAGLHLQIHFESELVHVLAPHLLRSEVPVVIDHMGRVDATRGSHNPDFLAFKRLVEDERFYIKVSGIDRIDRVPPYSHGLLLAKELVSRFPSRCVWGTDWPHLNHTHQPDDSQLFNLIGEIAPDNQLRYQLLVSNPAKLYGFPL